MLCPTFKSRDYRRPGLKNIYHFIALTRVMGPGQVIQVVPIKLILEIWGGGKIFTLHDFLNKSIVTGNILTPVKQERDSK